jgi:hypothetical protein
LADFSGDSPYPVGTPVSDPRLLQNRRSEIDAALEAVAPTEGARTRHGAVLGEQRSGRSSVLLEVARRAATERGRLVVWLRTTDDVPWSRHRLHRQVLIAVTEALVAATKRTEADWYSAWRDRVYLGDRAPSTPRDLLSSALVFAGSPEAELDRALFERDLSALSALVREAGLNGVLLCIDDASSLTEDVCLIEELVSTVDVVGGYSVLIAGLPSTAAHFMQAASPCLHRFAPVWLRPFRGPQQIFTSLRAPLTPATADWVRADDAGFLRDVLRLTGGNPHELMLVAHHLWITCSRGEQDRYALSPRVLDRLIPHLALLASGGDALRDGAEAIDLLAEEHVRQAVELVALSRLTVREIAIARILKIESRDSDRVDRAILSADIEEETDRVLAELEELERAGVIQLHADRERFSVVGGQAAAVLLKYKARARIGAEVSSQPFELGFVVAVGRALARDAAVRTIEAFEGCTSLGFSAVLSEDGAGRFSPRPAIRNLSETGGISRLVEAEVDLVAWSRDAYERTALLLTAEEPSLALVCTAVADGREHLEYTELWDLTEGIAQEDVAHGWSEVTEEWAPVVAAAELNWSGSEFAVVHGAVARQTLIVLQPYAAARAVQMLFNSWHSGEDAGALARAQEIADEAVSTMRTTGRSEAELNGELSAMLSRVGFLKSFDDEHLEDARAALEEALETGNADTWVTKWNLANIAARQGDRDAALLHLDEVVDMVEGWRGTAYVLAYVSGRQAVDSLVKVTGAGIRPLLALQRALIAGIARESPEFAEVEQACRESEDEGACNVVAWLSEAGMNSEGLPASR